MLQSNVLFDDESIEMWANLSPPSFNNAGQSQFWSIVEDHFASQRIGEGPMSSNTVDENDLSIFDSWSMENRLLRFLSEKN
jgi:hypothetical protein